MPAILPLARSLLMGLMSIIQLWAAMSLGAPYVLGPGCFAMSMWLSHEAGTTDDKQPCRYWPSLKQIKCRTTALVMLAKSSIASSAEVYFAIISMDDSAIYRGMMLCGRNDMYTTL